MRQHFGPLEREQFVTDNKIGLIAAMDDTGYPHIVFINTLMAQEDTTLTWGQFIQGLSKRLIPEKGKTGFAVVTLDRQLWRGKALYDHMESIGEAFDTYNNKPLFRYNSYFGIGQVHFMTLQCLQGPDTLKTGDIALGAILSRLAAVGSKNQQPQAAMNHNTMALFGLLDSLKFLAYEDADGYPWIVPCIQAAPAGPDRLVFSMKPFGQELSRIPEGARVAVFCATLQLQTVMVKGIFRGCTPRLGIQSGLVDVERVYNTMPPESGYIYPRAPLEKVTQF